MSRAASPPPRSGGVLTTPPWRRAPWLLFRVPVVFVAIAVAMAVLGVAAASGPVFLASVRTGDLHVNAAAACPEASLSGVTSDGGFTLGNGLGLTGSPARTIVRADRAVRSAMRSRGLPSPYLVLIGQGVAISGVAGEATLFSEPGAASHVQRLSSVRGSGVWVPDDVPVFDPHIRAGAVTQVGAGSVRVAGVYRSLSQLNATASTPRYWCSWSSLFVPSVTKAPPRLLIADAATVRRLAPRDLSAYWFVPQPVSSATVPQVAALHRRVVPIAAALNREGMPIYPTATPQSVIAHADLVRRGLAGSVVPIDLAAAAVALLLMGGAGGFWVLRRGRELRLLVSRGVGPVPLAGKAILEVAPALLLGAALGWFGAIELVTTLGPARQLEPASRWQATVAVAGGVVASMVVIAAVAVAATREQRAAHRRRAWLGRIPWELGLIVGAGVVYAAARRSGATNIVRGTVYLDPLVLAFPLLALSGTLLLMGRIARVGLPTLRRLSQRAGPAVYLAVRRMTGAPAVSIGVALGVALPAGILCYTASTTASITTNLPAKVGTYIGADHALATLAGPTDPINTDGHGTVITLFATGGQLRGGQPVAALGIQPATFARFAYHGEQTTPLISKLTYHSGQPIPALLINARAGTNPRSLTLRDTTLRIHIVARAPTFPGLRNSYQSLLVLDRAALTHVDRYAGQTQEVWTTTTDLPACVTALHRHHVSTIYQLNPNTFLTSTGLLPLTWIAGYLRALAILAGLVALTGLIFALGARVRRQTAAYVLTRRMGMHSHTHRRSLLIELGALLTLGWAAGTGLAIAAAELVYRLLDLNPAEPPGPALSIPTLTILASLAATLAAAAIAASITQHFADRANPGRILRLE